MRKPLTTMLIGCCVVLLGHARGTVSLAQQKQAPSNSIPIAAPSRKVGRAEIYYFPQNNTTSVDVMNMTIWGQDDNRIDLEMSYDTPGPKPRLPKAIELDIGSIATKPRFKGRSIVEFIVEGKGWAPISVEPQLEEAGGSVTEDYVFQLSVEQIRQIGQASSAVIKLGGLSIPLKAEHRRAFLDMLKAAD